MLYEVITLGETPAIHTVIIRYFADPTTMSNAIETGEIDIAWRTLGPVEAIRLQSVAGIRITSYNVCYTKLLRCTGSILLR